MGMGEVSAMGRQRADISGSSFDLFVTIAFIGYYLSAVFCPEPDCAGPSIRLGIPVIR